MESSLALELVRVTEEAALQSARWTGRGTRTVLMKPRQLPCASILIPQRWMVSLS